MVGPGAPADPVRRLEQHHGHAPVAQHPRRRQPGHPRADDDDAIFVQKIHRRRTSCHCQMPRIGSPQLTSRARRSRETLSAMSGGTPNAAPNPT